ncbi:MAG: phosphate acyltransferase PlsX [Acidobacteriota bacterium]
MRIALDAMGGDYAPQAIVQGAVEAARDWAVSILLVGDTAAIGHALAQYNTQGLNLEIVDAPDKITFDEQPALAVKTRKGLSMRVICDLVLQRRADACLTMGHTGAALVAGLLSFGRIEGIARPGVGVLLFDIQPDTFVIDIGANVDCKPEYLLHFALMGSIFMERMRGIAKPRVALLANGAEDNKGNALVQAAFPLIKASGLNFIGNVEGYDIPTGKANVIVTDAFAGNVVLKYTESLSEHLLRRVDEGLAARLTGDSLARAREVVAELRQGTDYAETGAVPLLGVNHLIFIGHGRASAQATRSAIGEVMRAVDARLVEAIREGLKTIR